MAALLALGFGLCVLFADAATGLTPSAVTPAVGGEAVLSGARAAADKDACTVIFVRHAEKDPNGDAKDPSLSDAGRKRAAALAKLLAHAGVTRLYASEFRRAQETLAPLAASSGHKVEIVPAGDPARLLSALASSPAGAVCVVAGHSNTIPPLIEKLGGRAVDLLSTPQGPQLRETEFDRMFVLTLGPAEKVDDRVTRTALGTLELRYGD